MVGHLPSVDFKLQPSKLQVATIEADNQAAFHQVQWSAATAVLRGVERLSGVSNEFAYQWLSHPTKRRMLLKLAVSALMNDCFWLIFDAGEYSLLAAHLAITPASIPSMRVWFRAYQIGCSECIVTNQAHAYSKMDARQAKVAVAFNRC